MSTSGEVQFGVSGAAGRMGKRIIALAGEASGKFRLVAALDRHDGAFIGQDAGLVAGVGETDVVIAPELGKVTPAVMIDFSSPAATRTLLKVCVEKKIALLVGTTGLVAEDQKLIDEAAKSIAILQATNTSLGVNVLLGLVAQTAKQLGAAYDIEIVEAHHNQKKDAPSGTALSLAEAICGATGRNMKTDLVCGRHGPDVPRIPSTVGVHSVRMGDVVGEHTVYFATGGERVEIKHVATSRDTFARGALRAAEFLVGKKAGRYTMADVLGLG